VAKVGSVVGRSWLARGARAASQAFGRTGRVHIADEALDFPDHPLFTG
jgi:hypothetical protein